MASQVREADFSDVATIHSSAGGDRLELGQRGRLGHGEEAQLAPPGLELQDGHPSLGKHSRGSEACHPVLFATSLFFVIVCFFLFFFVGGEASASQLHTNQQTGCFFFHWAPERLVLYVWKVGGPTPSLSR